MKIVSGGVDLLPVIDSMIGGKLASPEIGNARAAMGEVDLNSLPYLHHKQASMLMRNACADTSRGRYGPVLFYVHTGFNVDVGGKEKFTIKRHYIGYTYY